MKRMLLIACIVALVSQAAFAATTHNSSKKEKNSRQQLAKAESHEIEPNKKLSDELSLNNNGILN